MARVVGRHEASLASTGDKCPALMGFEMVVKLAQPIE
jgi:hypothetical protein